MDLFKERKEGAQVFRITFPDDTRVPFKLLTWGDYTIFFELFQKQTIPTYILENIIFERCVVEKSVVMIKNKLRAGIITTIVNMIMLLSGPVDSNSFNQALDQTRSQIDSLQSQVEMIICRAFPGYTPNDLQKMRWPELVKRLAQAERILMSRNPPELQEPIKLLSPEEAEKQTKKDPIKVNANDLVKEGRKMMEQTGVGRDQFDLTPKQKAQLRYLRAKRHTE